MEREQKWLTVAELLVRLIQLVAVLLAGATADAALFGGSAGRAVADRLVLSSRSSAEPLALLLHRSPLA